MTSTTTTHPAARHVEVQSRFDAQVAKAGIHIDFNFAYNPFIAYNER